MDISIYYIGYVTKKPEYNIKSVNPLYLLIGELDGFTEEKEGNKHLNISVTHSNNEVLINYAEVWSGIKDQIKKINDGQIGEYGKDYIKIILTVIVWNIFEKDSKCYPQIFLDDCLYEI